MLNGRIAAEVRAFGKFAIISAQNVVPGDFHIAPPFCTVAIAFTRFVVLLPDVTDFTDELRSIPCFGFDSI